MEGGFIGTTEPLVLEVREKVLGAIVATSELQLSISGVEEMYVHKNLRHVAHDVAEGAQGGLPSWNTAPNWPVTNGKNFVMVHGINVTDESNYHGASMPYRGVLSELFKRFWWAGMQERFCAVQWCGDEGGDGNYYQHVINAFKTAPALSDYVNNVLSGPSIVAGHSLGNMVISSAIQDHGMNVEKYFMLNAAVAKEAYYASAPDHDHMIPDEWNNYSKRTWASQYYKLFQSDPADDRAKLKWAGRFADVVGKAFNFYSSGDEVFESQDDLGLLSIFWAGLWGNEKFGFKYSWQLGELVKGTDRGYDFFSILGTDWAGWEFETVDVGNTIQKKYTSVEANLLTDQQLRTEPAFRDDPEFMLQSVLGDQQIAELLAKAIPATTRTAGKESIGAFFGEEQMNMMLLKTGDYWPSERSDGQWRHNDLFEVAYPYVHNLFDTIGGE